MDSNDTPQRLTDRKRAAIVNAAVEEFIAAGYDATSMDRIAASAGYAISQQKRKLIEQGFGWAKTVGRMRQAMVRGLKKVDQMFVLNMAAYNLVRLRSLAQVRP